jgi:hypothetical protein
MDDSKQPLRKLGRFSQDKPINPEHMGDELKAALGAKLESLDTGVLIDKQAFEADGKPILNADGSPTFVKVGPYISVTLTADTTDADLEMVERLIKEHDPSILGKKQQREKDAIDAYARLSAADFAAIKKLIPAPAEGDKAPVTREEFEALKAQMAVLIALMEDWQRLMVAARG